MTDRDNATENGSTRRGFMAAAAALCAAPAAFSARTAGAESMAATLRGIMGDERPVESGIALDIPRLAESGNSVPVSVTVESPMTAADHVSSIHLLLSAGPFPVAAHFVLGPRAGRGHVATRLRIFGSHNVVAIATMSDGTFRMAEAPVLVTMAACVEGN